MAVPAREERLDDAYGRYDEAFRRRGVSVQADEDLVRARMDLTLLLADETELPTDLEVQLTRDTLALLKTVRPLGR